jgi:hypothetical protein
MMHHVLNVNGEATIEEDVGDRFCPTTCKADKAWPSPCELDDLQSKPCFK